MSASNAASVHVRVCSKPTPPAKVSHEPSEISETSRSEEPSLRDLITLLAAGPRPRRGTDRSASFDATGGITGRSMPQYPARGSPSLRSDAPHGPHSHPAPRP